MADSWVISITWPVFSSEFKMKLLDMNFISISYRALIKMYNLPTKTSTWRLKFKKQ